MKLIQITCAALSLIALGSNCLLAAHTEQPIVFNVSARYELPVTASPPVVERTVTKLVTIRSSNIVEAIAIDLGLTSGTNSLIGGALLRQVDSNNVESITIRKGNTTPIDVSAFFDGSFSNNFGASATVFNQIINTNTGASNLLSAFSLNQLSLTTSNLEFDLKGRGRSVGTNVVFNPHTDPAGVESLSATVSGTMRASKALISTLPIDEVSGPALGSFSTGAPVVKKNGPSR
jgi:hypothetical protein